ncbi:MAG: 23S rRNA (uracil(1939)-C(5))-methyltransferase RlmD [Ruminococcus sp.]|nr:23S rRNA (uracil(1939)-C(5))-methyltransferase RlmD [Ruminococcus sp.]
MPEKNQLFEAVIEDITSEGSGVCHLDGMAVFVPDTAVGDKVKVRLVKVLKNYSYGIIEQMLSPSADRTENDCPVYKKCGGCVFRHISYEAECKIKAGIVENAFKRLGGIDTSYDPFISAENTTKYRNKAQYPVASLDGKAVCGFFAPRSHRIVPVTDCALQPEIFSEILETITDFLNDNRIRPYDEVSHTGIVRHIYLRQGAHSGEIMVCIVVRKELSRQLSPLTYILTRKFTDIKSIVMNINPDKTNVILGKNCITLWGKDTITDVMCGNTVEISPLSFYQVNTVQAERLYAKALEYAAPDKNDIIADLYCGAGTIGLSMAHKVKKIIGVEIVPEAVENARKNAERNSISNAEFYAGDAGIIFAQLRQKGCSPDIIVVDPPRKGCSDETLSQIIQAAPQKIVMISCNPSTAARDAKMLSQNGFSVDKVCGADLFPRTRHVECVVLMSRKK